MAIQHDPGFLKALDKIKVETALEDALADASEVIELDEVFSQVKIQGEQYRRGYFYGWRVPLRFCKELHEKRRESIHKKYVQLCKRLGLHSDAEGLQEIKTSYTLPKRTLPDSPGLS